MQIDHYYTYMVYIGALRRSLCCILLSVPMYPNLLLFSEGSWEFIFKIQEYPGEGHGNPLQYSCLENAMGRGACQATVHSVTSSQI